MKASLFLIYLFLSFAVFANDENQIQSYFKRIEQFRYSQLDSSIFYARLIQNLTKKNKDLNYHRALMYESRELLLKGEYNRISLNLDEALSYFARHHHIEDEINALNLLSILNNELKRFDKEENYLRRAIVLLQKMPNSKESFKIYNNLITCLVEQKKAAKATKFIRIYDTIKRNSEAENFYFFITKTLYFTQIEAFDLALENIDEAIKIAQKETFNDGLSSCYYDKGEIYRSQKKYSKALEFFHVAHQESLKHGHLTDLIPVLKSKIECYQALQQHDKALEAYEELSRIKDQLINSESMESINRLETNLKVREKEQLIALQKNKILQEKLNKERANQNVQKAMYLVVCVIVSAVLLLFFIFRLRKKNKIITEQGVQTELQRKELEKLNTLNQRIFATISHDFKGPLISTELLVDSILEEEQVDEIKKIGLDIQNQVFQSRQTLDNLLNFAKNELNLSHENPDKSFSPKNLCAQLISGLEREIKAKQLVVNNQITEDLQLHKRSDTFMVIFRNLLTNAIKFSQTGGEIKCFNVGMDVYVEDFGVGINPDLNQKIFKENVSSQLGTKNESGYGLGLKLAYELAVKNGWKIEIVSKSGPGSLFKLSLNEDRAD